MCWPRIRPARTQADLSYEDPNLDPGLTHDDVRTDGPTMTVLYVALVAAMGTGLIVLGAAGAIAAGVSPDGPPFLLTAVAMVLLTLPPIALGAFLQWWPLDPWRREGRGHLLRMLLGTLVLQAAGAVLVLVLASGGGLPLWQPGAFLALVIVLSAVNAAAAIALRRRQGLRPPTGGAGS